MLRTAGSAARCTNFSAHRARTRSGSGRLMSARGKERPADGRGPEARCVRRPYERRRRWPIHRPRPSIQRLERSDFLSADRCATARLGQRGDVPHRCNGSPSIAYSSLVLSFRNKRQTARWASPRSRRNMSSPPSTRSVLRWAIRSPPRRYFDRERDRRRPPPPRAPARSSGLLDGKTQFDTISEIWS